MCNNSAGLDGPRRLGSTDVQLEIRARWRRKCAGDRAVGEGSRSRLLLSRSWPKCSTSCRGRRPCFGRLTTTGTSARPSNASGRSAPNAGGSGAQPSRTYSDPRKRRDEARTRPLRVERADLPSPAPRRLSRLLGHSHSDGRRESREIPNRNRAHKLLTIAHQNRIVRATASCRLSQSLKRTLRGCHERSDLRQEGDG